MAHNQEHHPWPTGAASPDRVHGDDVAQQGSTKLRLPGTNLQLWSAGALAQEGPDALPTIGNSSADLNVVNLGIDCGGDAGVANHELCQVQSPFVDRAEWLRH